MEAVEAALRALAIPYVLQTVEEGGVQVKQLFFHDPDRNMLEVWCEFGGNADRCHSLQQLAGGLVAARLTLHPFPTPRHPAPATICRCCRWQTCS